MMPSTLLRALPACLGTLLILGGGTASATAPPASPPGLETGVHMIAAIAGRGPVRVKPEGWRRRFRQARVGMCLRNGDLLDIGPNTTVKLVCADRTTKVLPSGIQGVPCPSRTKSPLRLDGVSFNPPRGGDMVPPFQYPLLLSPRMGKVLSSRFQIRWLPVQGVSQYRVTLQGSNLKKTIYEGSRTEILYPADAPALKPSQTYQIVVWAGKRASDEEKGPDLGLQFLKEGERKTIAVSQREIRQLRLPPAQTQFLLASLYSSSDLYAEAVAVLENLSPATKEPAAFQLLGNLYLRLGLIYRAEKPYQRALQLAQAAGDKEAEAQAYMGLALMYRVLTRDKESREQWRKALAIYRDAGYIERARWIEKEISDLSRQ